MATSVFYIYAMATSFFYIYVMATSFFYFYVMDISSFYIYVKATSFFYIYKSTERPVVLLNAIFDHAVGYDDDVEDGFLWHPLCLV